MSENKKLLAEVNNAYLNAAIDLGVDTEEGQKAYELAMAGIDRETKMDESELRKKDSRNNLIMKGVEIGAGVLLAPVIDAACKKGFAKMICLFEKDYSFTTTAGRSLSSIFRFKK